MSVAEAQQKVSSREFAEWMAYYKVDPFGEERADIRAAQVCWILAEIHRTKGKRFKLEDFLLSFEPAKPKTPEEMEAMMMVWARQHNATVTSRKRGG